MSAAARLAAFALVLAAVFAAAAVAGRALGPFERGIVTHDDAAMDDGTMDDGTMDDADAPHEGDEPAGHEPAGPAGLALEEGGFRLVPHSTRFEAGSAAPFEFTILEGQSPRRAYDVTHEREMHLVVVRRDLGVFLHLHPTQQADGSWRTPLRLPEAGAYRAFADFSADGEKRTLGVDLIAYGPAASPPEAAPERAAEVAGYRVALRQQPWRADETATLRFDVTRDGRPAELGDYLGARGHLVVLREGDLAYLHTHAEEEELEFETTFPSPGGYRAFLQFRAGGSVHTASFSIEVRE